MKVLIPDIPKEGLDLELQESIESDAIVTPIIARLKIEKAGAEIIIKGDLEVEIKLQCSRCLKDFCKIMSIPIDVVYHPVEELKDEEMHEIKFEELDMDFYSGVELDLLNLINEQIILNLPMKPLCSDLCKGICVKCGEDLNESVCNCIRDDTDPRLEVLKKLLDKEA
ncbi:MAG: DUF177 domain-containing protein [Nitrospirae bacterium]|jgi:uncharacterized protein|nr:DUF177 domain-containing protein [Nitrospirota bacterium]